MAARSMSTKRALDLSAALEAAEADVAATAADAEAEGASAASRAGSAPKQMRRTKGRTHSGLFQFPGLIISPPSVSIYLFIPALFNISSRSALNSLPGFHSGYLSAFAMR